MRNDFTTIPSVLTKPLPILGFQSILGQSLKGLLMPFLGPLIYLIFLNLAKKVAKKRG
jgi:hypothetical protein